MKNRYLLTYVLGRIGTLARLCDSRRALRETVSGAAEFSGAPEGERLLAHPLLCAHDAARPPLLLAVGEQLVYAWIPLGDGFCLLGPVRPDEPAPLRCRIPAAAAWADRAPRCALRAFAEDVLLLYYGEIAAGPPYLTAGQLLDANGVGPQLQRRALGAYCRTVLENVENGVAHNPYSHEAQLCACVRRGDVEGLRRIQARHFTGRLGKLSADPVRQTIDIGIVAITLASRAAIEGGLHFELSYYLSDMFIQQLEACDDVATIESLYSGAMQQYAALVRGLPAQKEGDTPENRHISHCKDYIFAHLHEKLTVREIADAVGLEANYLSALFRRCERVPLKQFILHEKLRLARDLLAYSDVPYSQIAASLGFSSQSHLGAAFRRATGMTPRAYRMANAEDDFVRESMERRGEG